MNIPTTMRSAVMLGENQQTPATLLAALQFAFSRVEHCLVELDALARGAAPDLLALQKARVNLSQARHSKLQLVHQVCDFLLREMSWQESQSIHAIQRDNFDYCCASIEHVRYWTPDALKADWSRFCQESRRMRSRMKQLAAIELQVLLPLFAERPKDGRI